jgi:hypothetical protein
MSTHLADDRIRFWGDRKTASASATLRWPGLGSPSCSPEPGPRGAGAGSTLCIGAWSPGIGTERGRSAMMRRGAARRCCCRQPASDRRSGQYFFANPGRAAQQPASARDSPVMASAVSGRLVGADRAQLERLGSRVAHARHTDPVKPRALRGPRAVPLLSTDSPTPASSGHGCVSRSHGLLLMNGWA